MTEEDIKRLYYYNRQYLGFKDFQDEQKYHMGMRRRHNIAHHTWGIVVGLELVERPKEGADPEVDVYLQPGMAVDGFGREIILFQPYKLDAIDFIDFTNPGYYEVWIAYVEESAKRPAPGYELCNVDDQYKRVLETFRIVIQPGEVAHDPVIVNGKEVGPPPPPNSGDLTIPYDKSVPYQEFPADRDTRRWLVRLGSVNWDTGSQKFVKAIEERLLEGRQYIGNITAEVLAPAEELRISDRGTKSPLEAGDKGVKVTVEGSLQVERLMTAKQDVNVFGNVGIGLPDPTTPLGLKKAGASASVGITQNQVGGGYAMELTTADANNNQATRILLRGGGNNRDIEFYRGGRGAETHSMTIKGDTGNVGIGTNDPKANLHVIGDILGAAKDSSGEALRIVLGKTSPGNTDWKQYHSDGIYVDIDTSSSGFSSVPFYFTSLGGASHHWTTRGATNIYEQSASKFRVYLHQSGITVAKANQDKWHINWIAIGK